jgi:hypothetical protein
VSLLQLTDSFFGPHWCYEGVIFRAAGTGHREILVLLSRSCENVGAPVEKVENVIRKCKGGNKMLMHVISEMLKYFQEEFT